jgi:Ser/Thr protein kinase RdoA (MazF antagonist)
MLEIILKAFGIDENMTAARPFGNGLINRTWKLTHQNKQYILQRINTHVFQKPEAIALNIAAAGNYLRQKFPDYLFVQPVKTLTQQDYYYHTEYGYFRLIPFIENSHTVDVVHSKEEAFEAAKAFGRFTKNLSEFDAAHLQTTIPDFHNLHLRYQQFEEALTKGNKERIKQAAELITFIHELKPIVTQFEELKRNEQFKIRATHHDTKISNVLFNEQQKAICVIDLDTMMPGYFISDVGDMLRTYLSPVSEEEHDVSKIEIREDYFKAVVQGYLSEMNAELTDFEKQHFVYAGKFMMYMQALRFITDHFNNDVYYGARYDGHNLVRARNQLTLLQLLAEKENTFREMVWHLSPAF